MGDLGIGDVGVPSGGGGGGPGARPPLGGLALKWPGATTAQSSTSIRPCRGKRRWSSFQYEAKRWGWIRA